MKETFKTSFIAWVKITIIILILTFLAFRAGGLM